MPWTHWNSRRLWFPSNYRKLLIRTIKNWNNILFLWCLYQRFQITMFDQLLQLVFIIKFDFSLLVSILLFVFFFLLHFGLVFDSIVPIGHDFELIIFFHHSWFTPVPFKGVNLWFINEIFTLFCFNLRRHCRFLSYIYINLIQK